MTSATELKGTTALRILKNWQCDNTHCADPSGQVRVYPLGAGGNLILCRSCWEHENRYRLERQRDYGQPHAAELWPVQDWAQAVIYLY